MGRNTGKSFSGSHIYRGDCNWYYIFGKFFKTFNHEFKKLWAKIKTSLKNRLVSNNIVFLHFFRTVWVWLDHTYPDQWSGSSLEWPSRSPDLTPLDFFLSFCQIESFCYANWKNMGTSTQNYRSVKNVRKLSFETRCFINRRYNENILKICLGDFLNSIVSIFGICPVIII